MARKKPEPTAADLLGKWTDSDTAMQIVGTSLGVFGSHRLDPEVVLARETPLRNALFDVLLNLVEGGALDSRPTDDGHYAFRWRADYAVGALNIDTATTVDIEPPLPYLAELEPAQPEAAEVEVLPADAVTRALQRAFQVPVGRTIDLVALEHDEHYYEDDDYFEDDDDDVEPAASDNAGVVYLAPPPPPPPAPARMPSGKWSAYTLERPGSHRSGAERLANQG